MILINDFIERSESWQQRVSKKREQVAVELQKQRDSENTFHPRIDPVSERLHAKKLTMLEQAQEAKAAAAAELRNSEMLPLETGFLQKET